MPPPIHGASMVGQYIFESNKINNTFCGKYINLTTATGLSNIGRGDFKKIWSFILKLREIKKIIGSSHLDLIYITPNAIGPSFYKDFILVELCKRWFKGKIVLHFHNKGVRNKQDNWFRDILSRLFFKGVNVILLGKPLYRDIDKYVSERNVWYCANGIPDCDIVFDKKEVEIPHILWLSNILRSKGFLEFLDALCLLKERGLAFVADLVGGLSSDFSIEDIEEALNERHISDCVKYWGKKYGADKDYFFNISDVFVLPSYTEAFPLTILEAMQWGIPVVASNVGGISIEVIDGETGFLIGGGDPILSNSFRPNAEEIADKLELLLKDSDLRTKMGKKGYYRFKEYFTIKTFEDNFITIINAIISDNMNY
jgi:glycosyltransferase involved in cell wall biosynthesis